MSIPPKKIYIFGIWIKLTCVSRWVLYVDQQHGSTWFESSPQNSNSSSNNGPHTSVG